MHEKNQNSLQSIFIPPHLILIVQNTLLKRSTNEYDTFSKAMSPINEFYTSVDAELLRFPRADMNDDTPLELVPFPSLDKGYQSQLNSMAGKVRGLTSDSSKYFSGIGLAELISSFASSILRVDATASSWEHDLFEKHFESDATKLRDKSSQLMLPMPLDDLRNNFSHFLRATLSRGMLNAPPEYENRFDVVRVEFEAVSLDNFSLCADNLL